MLRNDSSTAEQPNRPRKRRVGTILACVSFALILLALDTSPLVHEYSYIGMGNPDPSFVRILGTVFASAAIGAILPGAERLPGALPIWTLAILIVIPAVAITPRGIPAQWLTTTVPIVGLLALVMASRSGVDIAVRRGLEPASFLVVLSVMVVLSAALVAASYGLRPSFATLSEMYSVRSEFQARSASAGMLPAYASGWLVNVLAPSLVGLGVLWRRPAYAWIGVASLVVHYLAVPSKLIVLLPTVVALLAIYLRRHNRLPDARTVAVSASALVALVWAFFPTPGNTVFAILVFRTIYIPNYVAVLWGNYFSQNPKGNFADAIPLVANDYDVPLPRVMANLHQGGVGSANANLWTDGYANLGYVGVVLVSLVLGLVLAAATSLAKRRDIRACMIIFVGPAISLLNNAAFTNLLTGGLALAVVLVAMLDESRGDENAATDGASPPGPAATEKIDRPAVSMYRIGD